MKIFQGLKDWFQRAFLNFAATASKFTGKIHAPWTHKKIEGKDYFQVYDLVEPGDILLSVTHGEFANIFIPGTWGHVAMAVSKDYVVEAITSGVQVSNMVDFMMKKDFVMVLRPRFLAREEIKKAMEMALEQVGRPYDYKFETGDIKKFYCSELVWYAQSKAMHPRNFPIPKRKVLGRETFTPSDFDNHIYFEIIWTNKNRRD